MGKVITNTRQEMALATRPRKPSTSSPSLDTRMSHKTTLTNSDKPSPKDLSPSPLKPTNLPSSFTTAVFWSSVTDLITDKTTGKSRTPGVHHGVNKDTSDWGAKLLELDNAECTNNHLTQLLADLAQLLHLDQPLHQDHHLDLMKTRLMAVNLTKWQSEFKVFLETSAPHNAKDGCPNALQLLPALTDKENVL